MERSCAGQLVTNKIIIYIINLQLKLGMHKSLTLKTIIIY